MRNLFTTLLEVAGLAAVSVGAWMVDAALGLVVAGGSAVAVGFLEGRK